MKTTTYALAIALGLVALVAPRAVWADPIVFSTSGTFNGGSIIGASTLSGTVTIDTTAGLVTAVDLSTTGTLVTGPYNTIMQQGPNTIFTPAYFTVGLNDAAGDFMGLVIATTTLVGFTGGPLCGGSECPTTLPGFLVSAVVPAGSVDSTELVSGSLSPISTPESSSELLLGIGLLVLGMVGITLHRKRLA
jgi:hypothetical protein